MIWDYMDVFSKIKSKQKLLADDAIDKMNRSSTIILAVIVSIFIGVKNFGINISCIDEPIQHVKLDMKYVESLCFAKDTYRLSNFSGKSQQNSSVISIYPWLPFIALFLGFSFYLPYLIWKIFIRQNSYHHMPVDLTAVNELLRNSVIYKKSDFNKNIRLASEYLDKCFSLNNFHDGFLDDYDDLISGKVTENREPKRFRDRRHKKIQIYIPLMIKYLFVKILYLVINISIFLITGWILQLDTNPSFFTFFNHLLQKFIDSNSKSTSTDYLESKYFPRIVFCDIHVRADFKNNLNINQYQCSLPANIFNEKAFLVLWTWFLIMIIFNLYSLVKWIFRFIFRRKIILNMLMWPLAYSYHQEKLEKYADSFIYDYMSTEGFLVIMLIKSNTKDWYSRAILRLLWKFHLRRLSNDSSFLHFYEGENQEEINEHMEKGLKSPSTEKVLNRREININPMENEEFAPTTPIGIKKNDQESKFGNNAKEGIFKMNRIHAV